MSRTASTRGQTAFSFPHLTDLAVLAGLGSTLALPQGQTEWVAGMVLFVWLLVSARTVARESRTRARQDQRILILGGGPVAAALIDAIESGEQPYTVGGVIDDAPPASRRIAPRWIGRIDELATLAEGVRPSHVVIAIDDRRAHLPMDALLDLRVRGVIVEDALTFYERLTGKIAIEAVTPGGLVFCDGFRHSRRDKVSARVLSIAAAVVGLALLWPLLAAIALAIKLESRGPVLFVQERVGLEGRPFRLLKFRTMTQAVERASEWVRDNDHRITRVGRILRRFRFDEIPQLVNILRGEMNLIGPRPHPVCNYNLFMERIPYYRQRASVLPGLTGWAQIRQGYANDLTEETEKMRYDLYYIKHRSLVLDLRILFQTIGIMALGRGATHVCSDSPIHPLTWRTPARASHRSAHVRWALGTEPRGSSALRRS